MKYRITDHTADLGIHVSGTSLKELFENAAYALSHIITDINKVRPAREETVIIEGSDLCDLMVNWLREILFFFNGRELFVKQAGIIKITHYGIEAKVFYERFDPERHIIFNEIKAVTYHDLYVQKTGNIWNARIIFDL